MKIGLPFAVCLLAALSLVACADDDDARYASSSGYDGGSRPEEAAAGDANTQWLQLSTDDSTSMASAQIFKAGLSLELFPHEFVNYYDPPAELFEAEPWAIVNAPAAGIDYGVEARANEDESSLELLFEMRAAKTPREQRRNWNLFYCVDVSGSMEGEKIAFVRDALAASLAHLKAGDRVTLVTFDDVARDVFVDLDAIEDAPRIRAAFGALEALTSTNMIAGLERAYALAQEHFDPDLLQRVLLFGDGNANVGDVEIDSFAALTRINGQEGIYLSSVGVGLDFDWLRMDQLADAGKGASIFLPSAAEVDLMFGDYFPKLVEVAADRVEIELLLPLGLTLEGFSGEEVSTDPEARLQNVILAAGDDLTFLARFGVERPEALDEPAQLVITLRPLTDGETVVSEIEIARLRDLFVTPGRLFARTRIIDAYGRLAAHGADAGVTRADIEAELAAYGALDAGLTDVQRYLP